MQDYPKLTQAVSNVLTRLREKTSLSQRKLANLSSVDRVYILQIEQGKFRLSLNAIFHLAEGLGISPVFFVELIEQERKKLLLLDEQNKLD